MARILIIDEDAPLRGVIAEALKLAGHDVMQAEDGRQGIELFKLEPADVVVTDLIMPGQEGIETIGLLRRDYPKLPIIAISGGMAHSPLYLDLALRLGAQRALCKPFGAAELLGAIDDVLRPRDPPAG